MLFQVEVAIILKFNKFIDPDRYIPTAAVFCAATLGYFGGTYGIRRMINRTFSNAAKRLITDKYDENLWELVSSTKSSGAQNIVETNLRTEEGKVIQRPLSSPKTFIDSSELFFNIAQLNTFPTPNDIPVEKKVTLGPRAKKPLVINIPIMVSGMGYGVALSEKAKVALAKGTARIGTATNTGEGAFLQKERDAAAQLILQYNRGSWSKDSEYLQKADMIEIQFGQGSKAGAQHSTKAKNLTKVQKKKMGLKLLDSAVIKARQDNIYSREDLKQLVDKLRAITEGTPIGIKLAAGKYLERDLEIASYAGVDVITLDGAEAAAHQSPPILQDDFGLPTIIAVSRATKYLEENNLTDKISLVISGGLITPGDFLKTLALGADAVYIGTAAILAIAHLEHLKVVPFEPPSQLLWQTGKYKDKFNAKKGADNLYKFLKSCTLEIEDGVRALGKTEINDINRNDLFTTNPQIADITGVELGY